MARCIELSLLIPQITDLDFPRGEKTATAMEHQLTNLENKIDDLLASTEEQTNDSAAQMLQGETKVIEEESSSAERKSA